jgi:hypothetical protein
LISEKEKVKKKTKTGCEKNGGDSFACLCLNSIEEEETKFSITLE